VERRHEVLEHTRRSGRAQIARADVVLDGDRNAGQRRVAPAVPIAIDRLGARHRAIRRDGVEGVEQPIQCLDAREGVAADVRSGSLTGPNGIAELSQAHPMTRGTRKRPASSAASGALARAASRSSDGRVSSVRSAAWRMTTLAVGATPAVSTCWTWSA